MIKYYLVENLLTANKNDFRAILQLLKTHDINSIVEIMLKRGTTLTRTDLIAVLNLLDEVMVELAGKGEPANLGWCYTGYGLSGVFEGPAASTTDTAHSLNITLHPTKRLKEALTKISLEKIQYNSQSSPLIIEIKDTATQSPNELLTSNSLVEIYGHNIKIAGELPEVGIYFVNNATQSEHKVSLIATNSPKQLIAQSPLLPAGEYTLKVITQYSGGGNLPKSSKTITLDKTLKVE